mmetsp:Transcript_41727/g.63753  ORF Transcript_41727/g.63753 Transcript_41727/m.63753 type:complete len:98 (-) Transcript_41727:1633-1926(-)
MHMRVRCFPRRPEPFFIVIIILVVVILVRISIATLLLIVFIVFDLAERNLGSDEIVIEYLSSSSLQLCIPMLYVLGDLVLQETESLVFMEFLRVGLF